MEREFAQGQDPNVSSLGVDPMPLAHWVLAHGQEQGQEELCPGELWKLTEVRLSVVSVTSHPDKASIPKLALRQTLRLGARVLGLTP